MRWFIIKKNKEALRVQDELVIYHGSYEQILRKLTHIKFDVIFLDPPFRMKVIDELIEFIIDNNMLKDDGYIVAEYPKEDVVNKNYENFRVRLCRRYSSSEVLILERE